MTETDLLALGKGELADPDKFPYPIHEAAGYGSVKEKAVLKLMDSIRYGGYNPDFPIKLTPSGKIFDGRHRQEACQRLGVLPYVTVELPRGGIDKYVALVNNQYTSERTPSRKEKMVWAAERKYPIQDALADLHLKDTAYRYLLPAYRKAHRRPKTGIPAWEKYKQGELSLQEFCALFGHDYDDGGHTKVRREKQALQDENATLRAENLALRRENIRLRKEILNLTEQLERTR